MTLPKFRAWDKISKTMFPVMMIDFGQSYVMIEEINGLWCERDFDEIELMQSTGLIDKNDKEIFEGDIVLIYGEKISKVFYSQGSFCVGILNGGTPLHGFSSKQLEVVGNIWENKELLEGN